jgi:hypothetical protein
MNAISRLMLRQIKVAAAACSLLTAAAAAASMQTGQTVLQPQCPSHGGTTLGPREVTPDRQNSEHGTLPGPHFSFSDRGWNPAAGHAK